MNRKLITNDRLLWPELSNTEHHEKILNCIETQLQNYPQLKRCRNPPKKERTKFKQQQQERSDVNKIDETTQRLKKHFLFGINTITRYLEKLEAGKESKVLCLFVCKSCKPLAILTRHLLIMCAQRGIKAACLIGLSNRLSKIFNMKRTSAFVILNESKDGQSNEPFINIFQAFEIEILPLIPQLKNPFLEEKIVIEDVVSNKEDGLASEVVEKVPKRSIEDILVFKKENEAVTKKFIGSDFFSFSDNSKEQCWRKNSIPFDSKNFIFNENDDLVNEFESEENFDSLLPSKKRQKTSAPRYFKHDEQPRKSLQFIEFDIVNRVSKRPKKDKKNKNNDVQKKIKVK